MSREYQGPSTPIRLDELLHPSPPEMDLNQPVEATLPPANIEAARSTTDPLQINFATADIADRLHNSRTSIGIKIFALVFFGSPMLVGGLWFIFEAWANPKADALHILFGTLVGVLVAGFWPYVIFANRQRGPGRS